MGEENPKEIPKLSITLRRHTNTSKYIPRVRQLLHTLLAMLTVLVHFSSSKILWQTSTTETVYTLRAPVHPINVLLINGWVQVKVSFKHPVYNEDMLVTCNSRDHNYCLLWDINGMVGYSMNKLQIKITVANLVMKKSNKDTIMLTLEGRKSLKYEIR
jgi:hypothetical protein